jgi:hypothetical protein
MATHLDEKIMEFLRQKENLPLALEVGRYATRLRQELTAEFWRRVQERLIAAAKLPGEWQIDEISWPTYRGWNAIEKPFAGKSQALGFAAEEFQGGNQHDIYIGTCWKLPVPLKDKNYSKGPLLTLRQEMLAAGFESWPPEWVCGKYVRQYTNSDGFYIEYAQNADSVVDSVIKAFSSIAHRYLEAVRAVNRSL